MVVAGFLPAAGVEVLVIGDAEHLRILPELLGEGLLCQGLLHVFLAPLNIGTVDPLGGGMTGLIEPDIAFRLIELHHVIVGLPNVIHIPCCPGADGELIIVPDQPVQAFQHPKGNIFGLFDQLIAELRVINTVLVLILDLKGDLPAVEAVGTVIGRRQGSVPKAHDPDKEPALVERTSG